MSNQVSSRAASGADIMLRCPACNDEVRIFAADAYAGKRVGCSHCGEESWLDRYEGEEGPGPWVLLPEEYGDGE